MILSAESSLIDVAFAVCASLSDADVVGVLCGGSAATFYAPDRYSSLDADFILQVGGTPQDVDNALAQVGYRREKRGQYACDLLPYTVDFPRGPLAVGRTYITEWRTERRRDELLHILKLEDVVKDRFLHYWAWDDYSALRTAVAVAHARPELFDPQAFREWADAERRAEPYDAAGLERFFELYAARQKTV